MSQHVPEEEFHNAVFVPAEEPQQDGGITITFTDFRLCAPEPLRLVVLMQWRAREQDEQPRSAEVIWSALTEAGVYSSDGQSPLQLDEVRQAVAFLISEGLVTSASDGAL